MATSPPLITPESIQFMQEIAYLVKRSTLSIHSTEEDRLKVTRKLYEDLAEKFEGEKFFVETVNDFTIPSTLAPYSIPVRFYSQNSQEVKPLIIYLHGGGWTRGSIKTHDALCRKLCHSTGWHVLSVDYRLAPEHPYPAALEDIQDVYNWCRFQENKLLKIQCIIVGGDSAGGQLSASLTVKLLMSKQPPPQALLLIYPAVDLRVDQRLPTPYDEAKEGAINFAHTFLKDKYNEVAADPIVSPIIYNNLGGFPSTVIISAECDPLSMETKIFADLLQKSGARVEYLKIPGVIHAFAQFFGLFPEAEQALNFAV